MHWDVNNEPTTDGLLSAELQNKPDIKTNRSWNAFTQRNTSKYLGKSLGHTHVRSGCVCECVRLLKVANNPKVTAGRLGMFWVSTLWCYLSSLATENTSDVAVHKHGQATYCCLCGLVRQWDAFLMPPWTGSRQKTKCRANGFHGDAVFWWSRAKRDRSLQ